ncbi:MAG: hypothetical protein ACTFAL_14150 [Candidatus Electronema sp. V4]|uniref:hypothetical protein n=1 Tax=Candidatus Electronema sp. V4 TaxID=3454756 RepID=UPI0040555E7C
MTDDGPFWQKTHRAFINPFCFLFKFGVAAIRQQGLSESFTEEKDSERRTARWERLGQSSVARLVVTYE